MAVHDAIVVGGGLSGLTTAALLAEAGKRVVLFERSESLGGRAKTTDFEGFFHLNLGPHAWYLGGPGTKILKRLGVAFEGAIPRPAGAFALYGDRLYTLPIGLISLLTTDLFGMSGKLELARVLGAVKKMSTEGLEHVPLERWLRARIHDERARAYVETVIRVASYADAPELLSAKAGIDALQLAFSHGVSYLDGGWQQIVDGLHARVRSLGVRIITSTPVAGVLHDPHVYGVRLEDGGFISAPSVVVAADPATVRRLVPHASASVAARWSPTPSKAAVLDVALAKLPRPAGILAFGIDRPLYFSVHSATAKLAPAGGAVIHAAKYLNPLDTHDPRKDERQLERLMDTMQPGWREQIVARRFLPAMTVTHAIPTSATGGLAGRPDVAVKEIPGLYLAGDWVGSEGTLANAAVASAALAARLISESPAKAALHDEMIAV
jgi:phytoene dehydrogenase-like protein